MKKLFIYLITILIFISCSPENSNSDFIVGEWKIIKRFENGKEIDLRACDSINVLVFHEDFDIGSHLIESPQGMVICGIMPKGIFIWEKNSNGTYIQIHANSGNNDLNIHYERDGMFLIEFISLNEQVIIYKRYH